MEGPAQVIDGDDTDKEVVEVPAPEVLEVAEAPIGILLVLVATPQEAATMVDPTKSSITQE